MKWLSVKKYKPPREAEGYCTSDDVFIHEWDGQIGVGYYDYDGDQWFAYPYTVEVNVTHFCIPDPIEIEDE